MSISLKEKTRNYGSVSKRIQLDSLFDSGLASSRSKTMVNSPFFPSSQSENFESASDILNKMDSYAKQLLEIDDLQGSFKETVREALKNIKDAKKILENEAEKDDREDIPSLLDAERLNWKMSDTFSVRAYRARAAAIDHSKYIFKNYHFPKYYSKFPLPKNVVNVIANVLLPSEITKEKDKAIDIKIREKDTAEALIQSIFKNLGLKYDQYKDKEYVFKAVGINEYMSGEDVLMWNYKFIRFHIRHNQKIHIHLIKKPVEPINDCPDSSIAYKELVDTKDSKNVLKEEDFPCYDVTGMTFHKMDYIPYNELYYPYSVKICGIDNLTKSSVPEYVGPSTLIFIKTFLFYGDVQISKTVHETSRVPGSESATWMQQLENTQDEDLININTLPRATRVAFLLYKRNPGDESDKLLAWVVTNLIDECGYMLTGKQKLYMWTANETQQNANNFMWLYRATTRDNVGHKNYPNSVPKNILMLTVEFYEFVMPVVAPWSEKYTEPDIKIVGPKMDFTKISKNEKRLLDEVCRKDPLYKMTQEDKDIIWLYRHHLISDPVNLPKFLQSVDWMSKHHVNEAHRLLKLWKRPKGYVLSLELLDFKYHDYTVRKYAVQCLEDMCDSDLQLFLLQMTQILKLEPYHDSQLCRFLIKRAIQNPLSVGHHLFWHLKADLNSEQFSERFFCILEDYLHHVGKHVIELRKQNTAVLKLQRVAETIVSSLRRFMISDEECKKEYKNDLERLNANFFSCLKDEYFQLTLDPRFELKLLKIDKCRYMSSKKLPLWLVFENKDKSGRDNIVIFKSGDDLRQDILTLQLLMIMDMIWLSEGLNMRMLPYNCIATGVNDNNEGVGMIEVVLDSETTSKIQLTFGGGAVGAFKTTPLDDYLRKHNTTEESYKNAQQNFVASCAGYCVATFILGIGDRHNGNIMLRKDGHLFHIDFGHFLGNFKSKMGWKRERCPFVFTPEMAFVMGGKKYEKHVLFVRFKELCNKAFNALRKHGSMFITLFNLMVSAGMPELMNSEDINYLRDMLHLDKHDKEAEEIFQKEIKKSLKSTTRQLDNLIHNWKHKA